MNTKVFLTAVLDASVLYSAPLRDLLLRLTLADLYSAKWSEKIHEEWIRAILRTRQDISLQQLQRTRKLMDIHVRDCLVTNYEELIPDLILPDINDRHVLAVAIMSSAQVIVTFNLKDFPTENLSDFGIIAQHPDDFIFRLIESDLSTFRQTIIRHRQALKSPQKTKEEYLYTLEKQRLLKTVKKIKDWDI